MKTKWKVHPAPTGRYRSFESRGWPYLEYEDGQLAASIQCGENYSLRKAASKEHGRLTVIVYDYRQGSSDRKFLKVAHTFPDLPSAKRAAEKVLDEYPEFLPSKRKELA